MVTEKRCPMCQTVKPADQFHRSTRAKSGLSSRCKACDTIYTRQRYHKDIEKSRAYLRERFKHYQRPTPLKYKNRPIGPEQRHAQYLRYRDKILARNKQYRVTHRDTIIAIKHRSRARQFGAPGNYRAQDWIALRAHFDNVCLACGAENPGIDHVIPLSRGGLNSIENLQPLCADCNSRKGTETIDYRNPEMLQKFLITFIHPNAIAT